MDSAKANDSTGESFPGEADFNREIARGEFEIAKTRFVRTLDAERFAGLINVAAKHRSRLTDEIGNLRHAARERHQTALEHARAYGSVLPHRVVRARGSRGKRVFGSSGATRETARPTQGARTKAASEAGRPRGRPARAARISAKPANCAATGSAFGQVVSKVASVGGRFSIRTC